MGRELQSTGAGDAPQHASRTRRRWGLALAAATLVGAGLAATSAPAAAATATSTALAVSVNPATTATSVTYTAVVTGPTAPGSTTMTGTVAFTATGLSGCTAQPVSGGTATCTFTWNTAGTRNVVATYSGDANWAGSTSAALAQQVTADGNLFAVSPLTDQSCGTFHDVTLPTLAGATTATFVVRGGAGGLSGTNTNGTPAVGQGGVARSTNLAYPLAADTHVNYLVGCGGGTSTPGIGSPDNGGAGWGHGGSGGAPTTSGPRGGGGGGGTIACLSNAAGDACQTGTPVVVAGGGGGTGPGVHYGGGGGGGGGGGNAGAKGGGCGNTPPSAGASATGAAAAETWYSQGGAAHGLGYGGAGGGGAGCGSNKGGAGGGGGGGTGGTGGNRCCTTSTGGLGGTDNNPGGGGLGETGNGSAGTGTAASGGNGGDGAPSTSNGATGGGGGGGYYGGGGGGAGNPAGSAGGPGGGGGGGSSWANTQLGAASVTVQAGFGQAAGDPGSVSLRITGPVISLTSPGSQSDTAGAAVHVDVTHAAGDPVVPGTFAATFTSVNLPPGLTIDPTTGAIDGVPTTAGTYPVVITLTGIHSVDGTFSRSEALAWTIAPGATTTTSSTTSSTSSTTTSTSSTTTSSTTTTAQPCSPDVTPFASASTLVAQLYQDLLGRAPTPSELTVWVGPIQACTVTADDLAVSLLPTLRTADDARLLRLYLAYFKRPPDPDGFAYWQRQLDDGRGLVNAALKFAQSSEFKRIYGSLSDADFVDLVYLNVLGRPADPTGRMFWITRLENKTKNRGQVMINFSESSENVRTKADHVDVFRLHRALLRTFPARAAYDALLAPVTAGTDTLQGVAHTLRHSSTYGARL